MEMSDVAKDDSTTYEKSEDYEDLMKDEKNFEPNNWTREIEDDYTDFENNEDIEDHPMDGEKNADPSSSAEVIEEGKDSDMETAIVTVKAPYVGMVFDSIEVAKTYYEDYGRQNGYSIRVRSSNKTRRGSDVTGILFVCSCEGNYHKKSQEKDVEVIKRNCSTVKSGCKANMRIMNLKGTNQWKVTIFFDEHNHPFVSPSKRLYMKCNRHIPEAAKDIIECFNKENLQIGKVASIFGGSSFNAGFDDRDCWNYLRSVRHKDLVIGDAHSVLTYFRMRQTENPNFFYAIQCDESGRATNFFWVDARSRIAYQHFGDMVTFDTTYRTNKYNMPFEPFTGVNHHYQTILFGCALLQDESEFTFTWLFKTWLEAMGGKHPISIITDQDLAMKGAIEKIFPRTRHRLCLWHIKKKFGEKLGSIYQKKTKFRYTLKNCIQQTYTTEQFEERWNALLEEYKLVENSWLRHLFKIRDTWVPVHNRGTFFAGMNTTGRSEGINAFFNAFVSSKTTLRDFVAKYEQALEKIFGKERREDFESRNKNRIFNKNNLLLKHASNVYTRAIFEKFRAQWDEGIRYKVEEGEINGEFNTYTVKSKVGVPEEFVVRLNLNTKEGGCGCQHFEFIGILCRHILKVLERIDVDDVPSHFILRRWTKEANRGEVEIDNSVVHDNHVGSEALRFGHLLRRSSQMASIASRSGKAYKTALDIIEDAFSKVSLIETELLVNESNDEDAKAKNTGALGTTDEVVLSNPNVVQTKGRRKEHNGNDLKHNVSNSCRWKSAIEIASNKNKRKCALCNCYSYHDKRTCPLNPNRKKNKIFGTGSANEEVEYSENDEESS